MRLTGNSCRLSSQSRRLTIRLLAIFLIVLGVFSFPGAAEVDAQHELEPASQEETVSGENQTGAAEPTAWQQLTSFIASSVHGTAGKIFVIALLATFCFSLAIIGDRVYYLYYYLGKNGRQLVDSVESLIGAGRLDEARYEARVKRKSPLGEILFTMLDPENRSLPPEEFSTVLQNKSLKAADLIKRNLPHLQMLANVATLIGLLGTIVGLILAFGVIANLPAAQRAQELTSSISLAMSTTAFGLMVAIPNLVLYSVFSEAASTRISTVEETVNRVQSTLEQTVGAQPAS